MLVSAIMPTADRGRYLARAIAAFFAQTWAEKELIILDDGNEPVDERLVRDVAMPGIIYVRQKSRTCIGSKRNAACELAQGEVIVHWDDDDWSAPERITEQVARLRKSDLQVTGYYAMPFYDERDGRAYRFTHSWKSRFALGTSLCYRREWWEKHRFVPIDVGEDSRFVKTAREGPKPPFMSVDAGQLMVARIHAGNTSPKQIEHPDYRPLELSELPRAFTELSAGLS